MFISIFIILRSVLSFIFLHTVPLKKSSVRVELDVSTNEERVDMEAESTSTITIAMIIGERSASIASLVNTCCSGTRRYVFCLFSTHSLIFFIIKFVI